MTAIAIYKPKHEILFKDGTTVYINSDQIEALHKKLETESFIKINDSIYNKFEISKVVKAGEAVSKLETLLASHEEPIKIKVRQTVREWKANNPTKELTEGIIHNMIIKHKGE